METLLQVIALIGVSLVLGLEHALETDHVVAVTTLTSQSRSVRHAVILAALWGLGHTVTLLVVSLIVLLLRLAIPPQIATYFELLVGFVLVLLGANVIRMVFNGRLHAHSHEHDGVVHTHFHAHSHTQSHTHDQHDHHRRSFLVGVVHGLAGSTALILLVLSSFPSLVFGLVFIVCFGLGSVLGMCLITLLISIPFKLSLGTERINQALQLVAGSAGVVIGSIIILKMSFPA